MSKKEKKAKAPKASKAAEQVEEQAAQTTEVVEQADTKKARSLNAITKAIAKKVQNRAKTTMEIGALIAEAKPHFIEPPKKEGGKEKLKTNEWLAWTKDNFGIAKAQHYAYIKIAEVFATEEMQENFGGLGMKNLYLLCRNEDVVDKAHEAIGAGQAITDEWVRDAIEAKKPTTPAEPKAPKLSPREQVEEMDLEALQALCGTLEIDYGKKKEAGIRKLIAEVSDEDLAAALSPKSTSEPDIYTQKLEEEVEHLKQRIEALLASSESDGQTDDEDTDTAEAQGMAGDIPEYFRLLIARMKSQPAHVVLGVAADAKKRDINAAKRGLSAIYDEELVGTEVSEQILEIVEAAAKHLA